MSNIPNILFYSRRPLDKMSYNILEELDKNKLLKAQFIFIDVDVDVVPEKVKKYNTIPLLIVNGINTPITEESILTTLEFISASGEIVRLLSCNR